MLPFWENLRLFTYELGAYLLGTVFFVSRFPEKKFPGVFDLIVRFS
jgi:predicted membrane channel-forming protein YqfA (hemolysin III family)